MPPPMVNLEERKARLHREFQKQNPPEFHGEADPTLAERWLKQVRKVLDIVGTPAEYQVEFAAYKFQGEVDYWWDSIKARRDVAGMNWEEFTEVFYNHYFRESTRQAKMEEFVQLQQKGMTVEQYAAKFLELSRFAPDFVSTEGGKTRRFERGLRPTIRGRIVALKVSNFSELIDRAMLVEQELEDSQKGTPRSDKGRGGPWRDNKNGGNGQGGQKGAYQPYPQRLAERPNWRGQGSGSNVCFNCNCQGHHKKNCPYPPNPQP